MKPSTPKGTRDFLPEVVMRRNYIFATIRTVFEKYGYLPIETPAMENIETLMGKYGDEGDRLIFKILNSGEFEKHIIDELLKYNSSHSDITSNEVENVIDVITSCIHNTLPALFRDNVDSEIAREKLQDKINQIQNIGYISKGGIAEISTSGIFKLYGSIMIEDLLVPKILPENSDRKGRRYQISNRIDQELISIYEYYLKIYQSLAEKELESLDGFFEYDLSFEKLKNEFRHLLIYGPLDALKVVRNQLKPIYISEKALRYDLTVPFARFVVQHQNDLAFPFRRYQIQPVWRADRPQKGRYREFFQCDADVVGTDSLRCEVEYVQIFDEVFSKLEIPVDVRINNRKLLSALAAYIGEPERLVAMTVAIDKLDKLPMEKVLDDLRAQGFGESPLEKLEAVLKLTQNAKDHRTLLSEVEELLGHLPEGAQGAKELRYIFEKTEKLGLKTAILTFDLSLARGLNYYTGAIFEVRPRTEAQVGSICGGGRYDNLTGIFGKPGLSGVGISFGADRIYDLLEATGKFPATQAQGTQLLFINFGESEADYCHALLGKIRGAGIRAELYPDAAKLQKQMKYANDKHIPYVALVGEAEMNNNTITLKHMETGEQEKIGVDEIIQKLS